MSSNGPAHCNCIKNYVLFVYVWLPWVFSAVCGLFLGAVRWGCSVWGAGPAPHGGAGASPFSGFSFGGQSSRLKWLWLMDLVAPRHVGSSQTCDCSSVPCMARQLLIPWATREVHVHRNYKGGNDGQPRLGEDTVEAQDFSNRL